MSKAEELAKALNGIAVMGNQDWGRLSGAASHLRALEANRQMLVEALEMRQAAKAMPIYGDYSGFVWPKVEMRKPGETAWGWICEKHGLGYQGGCICCSDDYKRHQDNKDCEARRARDDALHAADNKSRTALEQAKELT